VADRDGLLHCAWLGPAAGASETAIGSRIDFPPHSAVLSDGYTRGGTADYLRESSVRHRLREAADIQGIANIYVCALAGDESSQRIVERAGCAVYATLSRRIRLGKRKWTWSRA
jgi:hypothetical protein